MSSEEIAIRVQNLSKCYQLYAQPQDRMKQSILPRFQRWFGRDPSNYYSEFQALHNVTFEVKRGETVGIIGRNGSGKSTLLQIICGTLAPTGGSVKTQGRIAALLELGSGFNPEFTGRENVYMNGAILGLSREEIDSRFDDIAAFADIGQFIDQPVKTYSTGMMLRLAFAVIAHVDADILVVDEALSVGDAIFTQKCMRFIRAFQETGTVLFVSHDTGAVQNLCETVVWLDQGVVREFGTSKMVAEAYLKYTLQEIYGDEQKLNAVSANAEPSEGDCSRPLPTMDYEAKFSTRDNLANANGWKTGATELLSLSLERLSPGPPEVFEGGDKVRMTIEAIAHQDMNNPILGFVVKDRLGQDLFGENTLPFTAIAPIPVKAGQKFKAEFDFRLPMLPNGQYVVTTAAADGSFQDHVQHHFLHDSYVINVSSSKVRWGLVGLCFERVVLEVNCDQEKPI